MGPSRRNKKKKNLHFTYTNKHDHHWGEFALKTEIEKQMTDEELGTQIHKQSSAICGNIFQSLFSFRIPKLTTEVRLQGTIELKA